MKWHIGDMKEFNKKATAKRLLEMHAENPDQFTKEQQISLLKLALHYDMDFTPESKPIRKGLYSAANTATLGLVPESWRPRSIGQEFYGESGLDQFSQGLGSLTGLLGTVGGGALLARGGVKGIKKGVSSLRNTGREYAKQAKDGMNIAKDYVVANTPYQAMRTRMAESRLNNVAQRLKRQGQSIMDEYRDLAGMGNVGINI